MLWPYKQHKNVEKSQEMNTSLPAQCESTKQLINALRYGLSSQSLKTNANDEIKLS